MLRPLKTIKRLPKLKVRPLGVAGWTRIAKGESFVRGTSRYANHCSAGAVQQGGSLAANPLNALRLGLELYRTAGRALTLHMTHLGSIPKHHRMQPSKIKDSIDIGFGAIAQCLTCSQPGLLDDRVDPCHPRDSPEHRQELNPECGARSKLCTQMGMAPKQAKKTVLGRGVVVAESCLRS